MYDEITHECTCNRCNHTWRSRGDKAPTVCASCTSKLWNSGKRKLDVIISRTCGNAPEKEGYEKFMILEFVDNPNIESEDVFYISKEELDKYIFMKRRPTGSAMVFVGDFEIQEDQELKINELKLIYLHEATFNGYMSSVDCLYNVKSYYERLKDLKRREEERERKAREEEEQKQRMLEIARQKLEEDALHLEEKRKWLAEMETQARKQA